VAKENKYLFAGLAFLAVAMLAIIFEPFRHLPQVLVFILYFVLIMPGFFLIYRARQEMVKVVKELRPIPSRSVHITDTPSDRNWRFMAIGVGVVGGALAYVGRQTIMHTNRVAYSIVGWLVFAIGMMMVGAAFVLRKITDL